MDDVLTLISQQYAIDDFGVQQIVGEESHEIFCRVKSINRAEFFQAMKAGFHAQIAFAVSPIDYHGEPIVEFHGKRYEIYRCFLSSADVMELYGKEKEGTVQGYDLCRDC